MILERIVSGNLPDLRRRKEELPLLKLQALVADMPCPPLDMAASLKGNGIKLIAEVKKASPSKGIIRPDFDPVDIARIYARNGAAAISVLTEEHHFQGSLDNLKLIRESGAASSLPLLRKDFIHDPYQVYEARLYGADAVLLIAAMLTPQKLEKLLSLSHTLGMKCLVEVHTRPELDIALKSNARIIGLNNRDLHTFKVDLSVTETLRPLIPPERIVVSESGIQTRADISRLAELGVDAVLIGEALTASADIAAKMRELL
ncbi:MULTISPECIES: indole-3-glycerol phosphate synthase TrpC [Dehalococcoides]|uniref:Indole-3-glycerol phosphate synthase n=1 Tax=Dehalococcoides mccartyi TaxID=61435 RepID=A0AB38Z998_9CHLR|nr:indole-3-glycerol phosphate synthase TrpC [Dehalococcoides mccartyi]WRO07179.1 indole-3-glycerol phosphate synthase TrpC [Dehalococcoides mccartyi]